MRADLLKKVFESIKDSVTNANFDYSTRFSLQLQAMDSSHVALVALLLHGFEHYSRNMNNYSKGMNLDDMANTLSYSSSDDIVTIKADDGSDTFEFKFEKPSTGGDTGDEHLGHPEAEYEATVRMPASEFARICKDLGTVGDTVLISVTKEEVQFSTIGEIGTAHIFCKKSTPVVQEEEALSIEVELPILLKFTSRYLLAFTKEIPMAGQVTISMSFDMPVVVEYKMETMGCIRFHLPGPVENVPEVDAQGKPDVKIGELIIIEEGSDLKVEPKPKPKRRRFI